MDKDSQYIQAHIFRDMSEGMLVIDLNGSIRSVNPAAETIFARREEELIGRPFASCFFEYEENDAFNQAVVDAIYASGTTQDAIVPFRTEEGTRTLHLRASFLKEEGRKIALLLMIGDISELAELRDAVKAMETIRELNHKLEMRNLFLRQTFGRYLSDQVVEALISTPEGLSMGGKQQEVTVLMSDLRGFTAMAGRMKAEDLLTMLNHYFEEVYEVIDAYHGTLIEFLGDGLFVVFGAPKQSQTHASDAVAAAIAMQRKMAAVNAWNRERGYEELRMGIGINTGKVIVGNLGSEKRSKYGVTGAPVNTASRIEGLTVGGDVFISASTRQHIPEELGIGQTLSVRPKGIPEAITVYKILSIGGSYNLSLDEENESFRELSVPLPVRFLKLSGKELKPQEMEGTITAFAGSRARLYTVSPLREGDQICLISEEDVYATLTEEEAETYVLTVTAASPAFRRKIRRLLPDGS
ncbi:MAG: PAS domain S-box protein [Lachnospiraceae bacterium]|nr:PAS domain S-box protein [Lachnospiraceae bacterium]